MNRSRIESSESDSDAPVHHTKRKKLNSSVILESDSGCEDLGAKGECIQIDGADDKNSVENPGNGLCEVAIDSSDDVTVAGKGNELVIVSEIMSATATGATVKVKPGKDCDNKDHSVAKVSGVRENKGTPLSEYHQKAAMAGSSSSTLKTVSPFTGTIRDVDLDEDQVKLLVEVDSDDSLEEFIVNSDEEDVENIEPEEQSGKSESEEEEINVSNCHNRQFVASESESDNEDRDQGRKPSKRAQLMEQKRQAHKDKFSVFRKASRKRSK